MANNSKSGMLKWFVFVVIAAGITGGVWFWQHQKDDKPSYRTLAIERGEIIQLVTATGQLNPVVNIQVGSQISGIITNLAVDYNSSVKRGQIVAQLDPATYAATVHQSEGDLANAQAGLELAQLSAKRSSALLKASLEPAADDDKAQADLHQAEAQVKIKQAALERAAVDLERCTIYAPVDGVVISRNVDVGQTVAASLSAPTIFVIANDLSKMQIDANVSEADVGGVEEGQAVNFSVDAFPYRTFHGKVIQIRNSPVTVQNVVTYDTVIEVNNEDLKLKPGMTANVSIIVAQRENALRLPNSALRFRPPDVSGKKGTANAAPSLSSTGTLSGMSPGSGRHGGDSGAGGKKGPRPLLRTVYLMTGTNAVDIVDPQLKPVQIKTGISDGVFTEVTEGLAENDQIVVGVTLPAGATPPASAASSPFGGPGNVGGMRRF